MNFNRTNSEVLLNNLKKEELFNDLKNDKEVFMALRKNRVDFYYGGSKIFAYSKNGFESHKKFCFNADIDKDYILLDELKDIRAIIDKRKNYSLIKENASKFAGVEGEGVAKLYKFGFFHSKNKYILLDVEISLYKTDEKDRIDLLLFDTHNKELKFIEAKHFSNKELWASESKKPKVVEQIERYNHTIKEHKEEILKEYKTYVNVLNKYFNLNLPEPKDIYEKTKLLIFGFDNYQKNKIKELLENDGSLNGIEYYLKGNIGNVDIKNIYS